MSSRALSVAFSLSNLSFDTWRPFETNNAASNIVCQLLPDIVIKILVLQDLQKNLLFCSARPTLTLSAPSGDIVRTRYRCMFMCSNKAHFMPYLAQCDYVVCYRIEYEFWVLAENMVCPARSADLLMGV
jgi:hypothetical protein